MRMKTSGEEPARRPPAVGRQIRRWRAERGLTLAKVAEASGLNVGYLSQIENDKASPSLDALADSCRHIARTYLGILPIDTAPRPSTSAPERPTVSGAQLQPRHHRGSWTPEESQVESCEHQDNANIHRQPFPESVSEEHEIYTDDDGCHRRHVKHDGYLSAHFSSTDAIS